MAHAAGTAETVEQARRVGQRQLTKVQAEDVPVEERQRRVGLLQAGKRVLFGLDDVLEKAGDVTEVEVAGVAFVVEEDEAAGSVGVAFAGPVLAEARSCNLADQVEQPRR